MSLLSPRNQIPLPVTVIPLPGAVEASTVRRPWRTVIGFSNSIVPATANVTIRGPVSASAALSDPGPLSARVVTEIGFPPLPPREVAPNPSGLSAASVTPQHVSTRATSESILRHVGMVAS